MGSILCEFPEEIVAYVTSPRTGLQRRSKWPPTISEVLEACEQHQDYLRKLKERRPLNVARLSPPPKPPGYLGNVHVPEWHHRYARLADWTKTQDEKFWKFGPNSKGEPGVWIPLDLWQDGVPGPRVKPPPSPERDLTATPELRATLAQRLGQEPEITDPYANEST